MIRVKQSQQCGWSITGKEKTWWLESNIGDVEAPQFSDNKVKKNPLPIIIPIKRAFYHSTGNFDSGHPCNELFQSKWPLKEFLHSY